MADWNGALVGTPEAATGFPKINAAYKGARLRVLVQDYIELDAAVAQNDRVLLGYVRSDAIIDPVMSKVWFDDLGTSITMDIGGTTDEDILAAAVDVATAAGSCLLMASVDIANYHKPLWELLGETVDPGAPLPIYAKLEGGNPGTGTVSWRIVGVG